MATVFIGTSSKVQNDLIYCMGQLIMKKILAELAEANCVAIQIDESPDLSKKEQLSIVFRYVANHEVFERFVDFVDCSLERSAEQVAALAISAIERYKVGTKLVAQTYDGASVMSGEVLGVHIRVNANTLKLCSFTVMRISLT